MRMLSKFSSMRAVAGLGIALLLFGVQPVNATHLVDHRYTVWGEIKYEDGTPAVDVAVRLLIKDGKPLGEVQTDRRGRYRIVLHVHDEDVYKVFDMRVNNVTRKIRLLFKPGDNQTERGQRVDMIVKRAGEQESSSMLTQ